jgi:GntR family transcriptional repressor for pyruvate dehydrogenase complex
MDQLSARPTLPVNLRTKSEADGEIIYRAIAQGIVTGRLAAGSRLPAERDLAKRFGAARNTVRKTMKALEREGVVVRQVGRGTFVVGTPADKDDALASPPPASLGDIFEARLLFEPAFAELIVMRADDADFEEMDHCLVQIATAEDWQTYKEWKYALHLTFARATKNPFLAEIFQSIIDSRRRAGWGPLPGDARKRAVAREASQQENVEIVEALKRGDVEEGRKRIHDYLSRILQSVSEL